MVPDSAPGWGMNYFRFVPSFFLGFATGMRRCSGGFRLSGGLSMQIRPGVCFRVLRQVMQMGMRSLVAGGTNVFNIEHNI